MYMNVYTYIHDWPQNQNGRQPVYSGHLSIVATFELFPLSGRYRQV